MESFEDFDIKNPKYKKVGDLPRVIQPDFVDVTSDDGSVGFVKKSADKATFGAEKKAFENKESGSDPRIAPHNSRDVLRRDALKLEKSRKTVLDLLRKDKLEGLHFDFLEHASSYFDPRSQGCRLLKYFIKIDDIAFFKEAVAIFPEILEKASPQIRNNKEIALLAVSTDGGAIQYLSHRLQVDKDVVTAALQQNPKLSADLLKQDGLDNVIEGK